MPAVNLFAHGEDGLSAAGLSPNGVLVGSMFMFGLVALSLSRTWMQPRLGSAERDASHDLAVGRRDDVGADSATSAGMAVVVGRIVTVVLLALVIVVGLTGNPTTGANPVPIAVSSTFWYGGLLVAVLTGGIWSAIHPIAAMVEMVFGGRSRDQGTDNAGGSQDRTGQEDPHWWVPAVLLLGFVVLWICWPGGLRPRSVAAYVIVWSIVLTVGGIARGPGWVIGHDPFSLLFRAVGACSPLHRSEGHLQLRNPLRNLAARTRSRSADRATAAVLAVTLGATVFDAVRVTEGWADLIGPRSLTSLGVLNSLAMVWLTLVVAMSWMVATRTTAWLVGRGGTPDSSAGGGDPSVAAAHDGNAGLSLALTLVPALAAVAAGNRLGQELGRFLVSSQHVISLASDPFANGSNLFGTADWVDVEVISPATTIWLALLLILAGHVATLVVVHDWSVARFGAKDAGRVAWPLTVWIAVSLAVALRWMVG